MSGPAISETRDPSGIPETFDGQPVKIGLAAVLHAQATTDATPFLIGGWFGDGFGYECSGGIDRDPSPLLAGCETVIGGDSPWGAYSYPGPQGQMYWSGHQLPGGLGPSIVRVHTHDSSSAACRSDSQAACQAVLVVDDVLWTGDAWTSAAPISVAEAVRRLNGLDIREDLRQANGTLVVQRHLFATPSATACLSPWPHEVFELHGDPRFALVAVFPDEAARVAAQATLDPAAPGCAADPRVVRPAAATWVGTHNVLVLAYGAQLDGAIQAVLASGSAGQTPTVAFPPATLDESYRVVDDAEASRASGDIETDPVSNASSNNWFETYVQDTYRRFAADALTFTIGQGRPASRADMGAAQWALLERAAVPGTARLYDVEHPASTDPALAKEALVAFEGQQPGVDTWSLMVVEATPAASGDAATAFDLASQYETARAAGKWSVAWPLLSAQSQATVGSLAVFETEETTYNDQGGTEFLVQTPTRDASLVTNFLGASRAAIAREADMNRGYLVFVQHPNIKAASAGTTGLYVAPLRSGEWRVWIVH